MIVLEGLAKMQLRLVFPIVAVVVVVGVERILLLLQRCRWRDAVTSFFSKISTALLRG
jgi:hypothetical protein